LTKLDFELVVYDETEFFRAYDHDEFNYPYILRKTKIGKYFFELPTSETSDYSV
jgi:hypothetical protein